ncbi:unnamed protein product [Pleuronectes platessa]|uniref:Uncharacterized protein n=1 Tax=Pleuronectes platessa TaxID=8262 RepID=A0A9N7UL49_PLEPL|nr:unnamed protein product [Pleuronectes platessa]
MSPAPEAISGYRVNSTDHRSKSAVTPLGLASFKGGGHAPSPSIGRTSVAADIRLVYRHLHIGNKLDFHRYHWYLWLNRWARAAAGGAVTPSPSSPRLDFFFLVGGSSSAVPHGVSGAGAFFLLDRRAVSVAGAEGGPLEGTGYGGRRRRLWTSVGPFSRITSATAPAGGNLRSRGGPLPAERLGWHLAADLELVRTRGIRLFN